MAAGCEGVLGRSEGETRHTGKPIHYVAVVGETAAPSWLRSRFSNMASRAGYTEVRYPLRFVNTMMRVPRAAEVQGCNPK